MVNSKMVLKMVKGNLSGKTDLNTRVISEMMSDMEKAFSNLQKAVLKDNG